MNGFWYADPALSYDFDLRDPKHVAFLFPTIPWREMLAMVRDARSGRKSTPVEIVGVDHGARTITFRCK